MALFERAGRTAGTAGTGDSPASADENPAQERRWWRTQCRDVHNEHSFLTVLPNRDKVVLVGPPGRTAALEPGAVRELSSALRSAAEQARK